jgi:hypothetical protein
MSHALSCHYQSGDTVRSRSVSERLLSGQLDIAPPPARLLADWARELTQQQPLAPGEVEPLPLARARMRWPDYPQTIHAVADWTRGLGLGDLLGSAEVALMAARGARYHHDGEQYGGAAFCNLFLGEDNGQDLHFPAIGQRLPLSRGTVIIFDTCQPHAVIRRGSSGFDAADFPPGLAASQVFLSWELPIEDPHLASALGIRFDLDGPGAARPDGGSVCLNGTPLTLCAASGHWR